jgi:hypothetical protein
VQAALARAVDETLLPLHNREMSHARQIIESRKGVIRRKEYLLITLRSDQSDALMRRVLRSSILRTRC